MDNGAKPMDFEQDPVRSWYCGWAEGTCLKKWKETPLGMQEMFNVAALTPSNRIGLKEWLYLLTFIIIIMFKEYCRLIDWRYFTSPVHHELWSQGLLQTSAIMAFHSPLRSVIIGRFFYCYNVIQTVCVCCALSYSAFGTTNISRIHQLCL